MAPRKKKGAGKKAAPPSEKGGAAFRSRSKAAKKGWLTRKANEAAAAATKAKRSKASKAAWKRRKSDPQQAKQSALVNQRGWQHARPAPGNTVRYVWEIEIPGKYGDTAPPTIRLRMGELFDKAAADMAAASLIPAKWCGGATYKISRFHTDDEIDGVPAKNRWEDEQSGQRGLKDDFGKAKAEAESWVESLATGDHLSELGEHAYRIWIRKIFVICHVNQPKPGKVTP